jgi:hypothetical protein
MIDLEQKAHEFLRATYCCFFKKPDNATFRENKEIKGIKVLNQLCAATHARVGRSLPQRTLLFIYDDPQRWLRSPGQHVSQSDNEVNRSRPVFVRNHACVVAVEFK